MKVPSLIGHVLNPDSRKVGFGYQVFIWATYAAFFAKGVGGGPLIDASTWLLAVTASTALIGGGTIMDDKHDLNMAKITGGPDAAPAPAPVPAPPSPSAPV